MVVLLEATFCAEQDPKAEDLVRGLGCLSRGSDVLTITPRPHYTWVLSIFLQIWPLTGCGVTYTGGRSTWSLTHNVVNAQKSMANMDLPMSLHSYSSLIKLIYIGGLIPIAFLPHIKTQLIYRTVSILFDSIVDHMALLNSDTWCRLNVAPLSSNLICTLTTIKTCRH